MYKDNKIAIVIPAHNEEKLIERTIKSIPNYVDHLVVINDSSSDKTKDIVEMNSKVDSRIILINHEQNQGVGGSIATGYEWARDNQMDIAVVMGGDGQMDPDDLPNLLDALIEEGFDYAKGNRLFSEGVRKSMPATRYYASQVLSLLTKIASGYWHVVDPQSGYTAINKKALHKINWKKMYRRYGQPNDLLVRLNVENYKVKDVEIKPVYNIGEKSEIKTLRLVFSLSWLLFKDFLWRLKEKYIIRDFHPLVFFYGLGGLFWIFTVVLGIRLIYFWIIFNQIPSINALGAFFSFMSASLFTLFAMWFDMSYNQQSRG